MKESEKQKKLKTQSWKTRKSNNYFWS